MIFGWKECPRCGEEVKDNRKSCKCGWKFYKKKCPRCGEYLDDSEKICYRCGWYFYWEDHIGEDDEYECNYDEFDYEEDDCWDFWRETAEDILGEDLSNIDGATLGEILDDLGF
ncbi:MULTISPECIES: zinc ribbon domain-containing protein [unclassified Thermosipho (in: thermotogales)]|uniref:zinc ribbon domain-containing protein n=1 Tax=unclassified Thermosipho (in: thermotogales) TaxID=2676525 RepID=UPI00098630C9|nr:MULTISPECIES: zinc ribbon domain-containing protein [unclassified Thermosipho (in: thermotogales)]MBT1248347.1 hypothetical protein [Thermosipho sp. 1244]OOC47480.1 hypothetical protein XO09_00550 [Thermosipho sp. 1223]